MIPAANVTLHSYIKETWWHYQKTGQPYPRYTRLEFCHMLEKNNIGEKIFADVNKRLDEAGLMMHGGTIVDASLIAAPKST